MFVANSITGQVVLDETLTHTHTQPVLVGDIVVFDLIIVIEHEAAPDAIILTVSCVCVRARVNYLNLQ